MVPLDKSPATRHRRSKGMTTVAAYFAGDALHRRARDQSKPAISFAVLFLLGKIDAPGKGGLAVLQRPHIQALAESLEGGGDTVDAGGVVDVGEAVDFLWGGFQAARQFGGADLLLDHLV